MAARRRRGLSLGSILVLLMTVAALLGTAYFVVRVAGDSPAASMHLDEIIGAVEQAIRPGRTAAPSPAP